MQLGLQALAFGDGISRGRRFLLAPLQQQLQLLDFALALDHAMDARIGNVEREAPGSAQMAGAIDAEADRGVRRRIGGELFADGDAGQPFVQHLGPVRILAAHLGAQRIGGSLAG
ncbi:hypothetical protein GALL_552860 [mine drainage metagenome]|uniref:Uncharacterized protein n=1 Tax=mine drainage metagenome TaxID=410659 RepID=A0A1J5NWQ5_9ZZZZ